jgi:hypothetical protein
MICLVVFPAGPPLPGSGPGSYPGPLNGPPYLRGRGYAGPPPQQLQQPRSQHHQQQQQQQQGGAPGSPHHQQQPGQAGGPSGEFPDTWDAPDEPFQSFVGEMVRRRLGKYVQPDHPNRISKEEAQALYR